MLQFPGNPIPRQFLGRPLLSGGRETWESAQRSSLPRAPAGRHCQASLWPRPAPINSTNGKSTVRSSQPKMMYCGLCAHVCSRLPLQPRASSFSGGEGEKVVLEKLRDSRGGRARVVRGTKGKTRNGEGRALAMAAGGRFYISFVLRSTLQRSPRSKMSAEFIDMPRIRREDVPRAYKAAEKEWR